MRNIAIVGTGGVGQRHAESCAALPASGYRLHLVEPNDEQRLRANDLLKGRDAVSWYASVGDLPQDIDLAIVATRADIRASITKDILEGTSVRSIILEKVLFQKLADYATTSEILTQARATTWVNCPRRLWPSYRRLNEALIGQDISRIEMSGADWDIGCNAIHFLDLFAFLARASGAMVDKINLGNVRPAKRSDMLHIEGEITGHLMRAGKTIPFRIASTPEHCGPQTIDIETAGKPVEIIESVSAMTISGLNGHQEEQAIPFQSQLTALTLEEIFATGRCGLTSYEESRALHETFVATLLVALAKAGKLADRTVCPIT